MASFLKCLLGPGAAQCTAKTGDGSDGKPQSTQIEDDIVEELDNAAAKAGQSTPVEVQDLAAAATAASEDVVDAGIDSSTPSLLSKSAASLQGTVLENAASDWLPVVGWIKAVLDVLNTAAGVIGPTGEFVNDFHKLAYITNAGAYARFYMVYRTHADEIKAGKVSSEVVSSFSSTLGSDTKNGESAESSPLYSYLLGNGKAAGSYTCDNGKKLESNKLICPEESLVASNFLTPLREALQRQPLALWVAEAQLWNNSIGKLLNFVNDALGSLSDFILSHHPQTAPLYNQGKELMTKYSSQFFLAVMEWLVPSPISADMSGARSFNSMAAGASESARAFCTDEVGCKSVSAVAANQIRQNYALEQQEEFKTKPFLTRMFDTDSQYSAVSRLAMSMPTDKASINKTMSSFISKPFHLASVASSLWTKPAIAQTTADDDPWGIPSTAYPNDDVVFKADPETLTDDVCEQINRVWQSNDSGPRQIAGFTISGVKEDPETGMPIHDTTNPCMINDVAVGAAGGWFSDSNLNADDLAGKPTGSDDHFAQADLTDSGLAGNGGVAYKNIVRSSPTYQSSLKLGTSLSESLTGFFHQLQSVTKKLPIYTGGH